MTVFFFNSLRKKECIDQLRFQRLYFNQEFLIQSYLLHISRYLYSDHKTTDSVESLSGNTLFFILRMKGRETKKKWERLAIGNSTNIVYYICCEFFSNVEMLYFTAKSYQHGFFVNFS